MITRQYPLELKLLYPLDQKYDLNRTAFFDIETTGLDSKTTYLYLIGCIYYKDTGFYLIQWFSEDISEEALLITSFFDFLKDYDVLIHYNGTGFDIPYLLKKCDVLTIEEPLSHMESVDLYKKITQIKNILNLKSYRQKAIEKYLCLNREDILDGEELIAVYQSYLGKKHYETLKKSRVPEKVPIAVPESEFLLKQLLLHNADDLEGLVKICPILYYTDLPEKPVHVLEAVVEGERFKIRFELSFSLPVPVNAKNDLVTFSASGNCASVSVLIYKGVLKHFYDDYKDYYYLPAEDTAIHKSVAQFVEKEYRQKAKPSNCYVKKEGLFAPQYEPVITPFFKNGYQDKLTFLEIHTDFLLQEENLEQYVLHLIKQVAAGKV